ETLKQVLSLSRSENPGKLDSAVAARLEFTSALKEVVKGLASGKSPETMMGRLLVAVDRLNRQAQLEIGSAYPEDVKEFTGGALKRAMDELDKKDPALVRRAQGEALAGDSALRAIHARIGEQLEQQAGLPEADRLIPRQVEALEAIHAISEALVE